MEFAIEFYESETGKNPVRAFLDDLRTSDPDDFTALLAGIARLRNRQYHRPPLSQPLSEGICELRHVGKLNTRILYFFAAGQRIILLHGIRAKAIKLPARDLKMAKVRKRDWVARNTQ
jgi:phage-related protein